MNEKFLFSSLKYIDDHTANLGIDKGQNLSHTFSQHFCCIGRISKALFICLALNISIQLLVPFLKLCKRGMFPVLFLQYQFHKLCRSFKIIPCGAFHFRIYGDLVDTLHRQIHAFL